MPLTPATLWTLFALACALLLGGAAMLGRARYLRRTAAADRVHAEETARRLEQECNRRRIHLHLIERALAGGRLEALFRNAADALREGLGVRYGAVLESTPQGRALDVVASSGWDPGLERLALEATVDGQPGYALFAREAVVVSDAEAEQRFAIPPELRAHGARSGIAVRIGPVRPYGVLAAYDAAPRAYDDSDVEFTRAIAAALGAACERGRIDDERIELVARDEVRRVDAQRAERRAAFLAQTATVLDAALQPATTLVSLARLAVPAIADCAVVDLVEEDGQVRRIEVVDIDPVRRRDAETLQRLTPDLRTDGPFPRAIRTGQPVLLPEIGGLTPSSADAGQLDLLARLGCESLLLVPLVARGQTLGLLTLGSRRPFSYEGADLLLAQELAGRAAIALDNGRLHREAHAASRAKDEFLAMVSHELRTPLNAVLGWAAILRTRPPDDGRARQALDAIERSVRAQAQLLEQLLDVSRIIAGKFELRCRPVRLQDVIGSAVDAVRPDADERAVRIEARLDAALPQVQADPDRLQQVVVNLLSNAVKFTPESGTVHVELRAADGERAEIVVRDHGIGIRREFLPYVFDRFRQANGQTPSIKRGLGLGLSIVRDIVEKHGGSVTADSDGEGRGATFRVVLPLHARPRPLPDSVLAGTSAEVSVCESQR